MSLLFAWEGITGLKRYYVFPIYYAFFFTGCSKYINRSAPFLFNLLVDSQLITRFVDEMCSWGYFDLNSLQYLGFRGGIKHLSECGRQCIHARFLVAERFMGYWKRRDCTKTEKRWNKTFRLVVYLIEFTKSRSTIRGLTYKQVLLIAE